MNRTLLREDWLPTEQARAILGRAGIDPLNGEVFVDVGALDGRIAALQGKVAELDAELARVKGTTK